MIENGKKILIAGCQGANLVLMCDGVNARIDVGSWIYAAELAEAINKLAGPDDDEDTDDD